MENFDQCHFIHGSWFSLDDIQINKSLGFIKRNIKTKHPGVRETAYKTIVRPQLEYASPVWGPYTQSNIYKVEMVQRRAIRWILNNFSPYDSVSQMQLRLGWRSLD